MSDVLFEIRDVSNVAISLLEVADNHGGVVDLGSVRLALVGSVSGATMALYAMTIDCMPVSAMVVRGFPGMVIDNHWLEAKIGAGSWTPIGGHPLDPGVATLAIPDLTSPGHADVALRLNIPSGVAVGVLSIMLAAGWHW